LIQNIRSLSFLFLLTLTGTGWADEPKESTEPSFQLTGIVNFDPVYTELQVIKGDIIRAENQVKKAHALLLGAVGAEENMSLDVAIRRHQELEPAVLADGAKIALANREIDGAKSTLAQVPDRFSALQIDLVRLEAQAPEAGRVAGWNTRERLTLVRTVESNQQAASQLPLRATEGVRQANLMLSHLKGLEG
jgi:hypothetical protein